METLKEERPLVVVKRLRNRNIFIMERSQEDGPAAKRCRMENRDGQQIIQEKQRTIENLKELQASKLNLQAQITEKDTRIQQFEDPLKELTGSLLETKVPNEIILKIFGYLSTYDVLRNVARVSTKFYQLSKDPCLIRKLKISKSWPRDKTREYSKSLLQVLKRSRNLTFFSIDFEKHSKGEWLGWLMEELPGMNPKLKIIKVEFKPRDGGHRLEWKKLSTLQKIITSFKLNSAIEQFEMIGFEIDVDGFCFENVLETFTETFPKLKRLCLTADIDDDDLSQWDPYAEFCQEFASENNIKLEFERLDWNFAVQKKWVIPEKSY